MSQKNSCHCSFGYQQESIKKVLKNLNTKLEEVKETGETEIYLIGLIYDCKFVNSAKLLKHVILCQIFCHTKTEYFQSSSLARRHCCVPKPFQKLH